MMDYNETDTCWHIMTRTHGGTVSLMQNLDAPTARQAYRKLNPSSYPTIYFRTTDANGGFVGHWSGGGYSVSEGDITKVDILGPEGCDLDPWRGEEPNYFHWESGQRKKRITREEYEALKAGAAA